MSSDSEISDVVHVRQRYSWDCGLACAQMILKTQNKKVDKFHDICKKINITDSVWTVDIAHLLTQYGINYLFVTRHAGINQSYKNDPYYKDSFKEDFKRVNRLFMNASNLKIHIQERPVKQQELIDHLEGNHAIIILLDWSIIKQKKNVFNCLNPCGSLSYSGHYVVLISYNEKKDCFYYLDPQGNKKAKSMKRDVLENARKSYGTDEDTIFIYD